MTITVLHDDVLIKLGNERLFYDANYNSGVGSDQAVEEINTLDSRT